MSFLNLPPELRLCIYDEVLQPLLATPEHYDTYVLPEEWLKKSFADYRALLLVDKEISNEIRQLFLSFYVDKSTLFFNNSHDLHSFARRLPVDDTRQSRRLQDMQISLHQPDDPLRNDFSTACFMLFMTQDLEDRDDWRIVRDRPALLRRRKVVHRKGVEVCTAMWSGPVELHLHGVASRETGSVELLCTEQRFRLSELCLSDLRLINERCVDTSPANESAMGNEQDRKLEKLRERFGLVEKKDRD